MKITPALLDFLGFDHRGFFPDSSCCMGGGGDTTSTQKADPWYGQQPYLTDIYSQAGTLDRTVTPQYFPYNTYAGITPQQSGLMADMISFGQGGGSKALQGANANAARTLDPSYTWPTQEAFARGQQTLASQLDPGYLNPWNSPSFDIVAENTLAKALPAATHSFVKGNRSDSGLATRAATMAATDSVGQLAQNQYQANQALQNAAVGQASGNFLKQQEAQNAAMATAPLIDQTEMGGLSQALATSGLSQKDMQNQISAAIARYNYEQMLPWNQLSLYQNAIMGNGSPGGTTTTTQPQQDNTFGQVATGVGTAATVAMSIAAMM